MAPDPFYRLSTLREFISRTRAKDIRVIVDIGVNVGDLSLLMHDRFPQARIIGFEPVREYFETAAARTSGIGNIELHNNAVTGDHLFFDDLGQRPRPCRMELTIVKALPESGHGWRGGSVVHPVDNEHIAAGTQVAGYRRIAQPVDPITLAGIVARHAVDEIDLLKIDCEGCENSVLGSADIATLRRIRFITGEYHHLTRFDRAIRNGLFTTHKVLLDGDRVTGSFFAERRDGDRDGLLLRKTIRAPFGPDGDCIIEYNPMREMRSWLERGQDAFRRVIGAA